MDLKETILETLQEIESFEDEEQKECKEVEFLEKIRDRLLVLFEGLQSPNTQNLEVKLDVTINFLEYLLVRIDEKLKK
jgi:SpoU rRNA methylase family enzyme